MDLANQQANRANWQGDQYNQYMRDYMTKQQGMIDPLLGQMGGLTGQMSSNADAIGNVGQGYQMNPLSSLGNYDAVSMLKDPAMVSMLKDPTALSQLSSYGDLGGYKQLSEGLSPQAMAAMQGQAMDTIPAKYDQARQQLAAKMGSRGLGGAMGTMANQFGDLEAQKAAEQAGSLRNITLQDENLRNTNMGLNRQFNSQMDIYNQQRNVNRDLGNADIAKFNAQQAYNTGTANQGAQQFNSQMGFNTGTANQAAQQFNNNFLLNRDLQNSSIADKNNQYLMAQRQQALAELLGKQGALGQAAGNATNQGALINSTYNPYQWAGAANTAQGNATGATGLGMQGAGQNAQLAQSQRGFWDSIGGPLIGAATSIGSSYLGRKKE
jgi:hypothetical protein